jgi:subtilisin family serine protease
MPRRILATAPAAARTSLVLGALVLAACSDGGPASLVTGPAAVRGVRVAAPRYLVGLESADAQLSAEALAAAGSSAQVVDAIPALNVVVVDRVTNPAALQGPGVAYVEEEFTTQVDDQVMDETIAAAPLAAFNAPWYQSRVQWDMQAMRADEAWAFSSQGQGANVCIVDTGVDNLHQELATRVPLRANFVTSPAAETAPGIVNDGNGHGSHVAGTVAAGGTVMYGVAPKATILGARVLNNAGSGSQTAIMNAIRWCADNGSHVINASLGGRVYRGDAAFATSLNAYSSAIKYATDRGVVVVVAAGNDNIEQPNPGGYQYTVPAQALGVISVGATGPVSKAEFASVAQGFDPLDPAKVWQSVDGKAFYSNYGRDVTVFAPGGRGSIPFSFPYYRFEGVAQGSALDQIYSICPSTISVSGQINVGGAPGNTASCLGQTNRYRAIAGTSMAAPHVAGMAAVLYAELGGTRSDANRLRVESCIKSTTDNIGPASTFGGGRVNVVRALAALRSGSC